MVGNGGNRPKLAELNPHTPITVHPGATLVAADLAQYKVIVMTDATLAEELAVSDATHANGTQCVNGFSSRFYFHGPIKPSLNRPFSRGNAWFDRTSALPSWHISMGTVPIPTFSRYRRHIGWKVTTTSPTTVDRSGEVGEDFYR
jgi:hypothetical protein